MDIYEQCERDKVIPSNLYCQYRKRLGDVPGWCTECDCPCSVDLGEGCWNEELYNEN